MTEPQQGSDNGGGGAAPEAPPATSLKDLDARLDRLEAAMSRLVPGSQAQAQARTEDRLDRGSDLEERVRAELAKAEEERKRKEAADKDKQDRETLAQRVKKLEERPPAQEVRRATRLTGWA
jgi:hypothetical protein